MDRLLPSVQESIVKSISYRVEPPKLCENCKYSITREDGICYGSVDYFCGVVKTIGYFEVDPKGTCSKFSPNPAP